LKAFERYRLHLSLDSAKRSATTILAAFVSNVLVAIAKNVAAVLSGSDEEDARRQLKNEFEACPSGSASPQWSARFHGCFTRDHAKFHMHIEKCGAEWSGSVDGRVWLETTLPLGRPEYRHTTINLKGAERICLNYEGRESLLSGLMLVRAGLPTSMPDLC
jgi:hypothetical protein